MKRVWEPIKRLTSKVVEQIGKEGNKVDVVGDGVNLTDWRRAVEQDALSHVSHPLAAFQVETRRLINTSQNITIANLLW